MVKILNFTVNFDAVKILLIQPLP